MDKVLFSSKSEVWGTPQAFFDTLDKEFHFTLDPCALPENAKCKNYFTPETDGLRQDWQGQRVFCNPPYGKKITDWVEKCYKEGQKPNTLVVLLIPIRTSTLYFYKYIYHKAQEIRFIKGRLKFTDISGKTHSTAPFPSMIVIFKNEKKMNPAICRVFLVLFLKEYTRLHWSASGYTTAKVVLSLFFGSFCLVIEKKRTFPTRKPRGKNLFPPGFLIRA